MDAEKKIQEMKKDLKDTLVIVSADHGHHQRVEQKHHQQDDHVVIYQRLFGVLDFIHAYTSLQIEGYHSILN